MPGPGAYDSENRNTFVALLARKRFGRAGAFGSKSKRLGPFKAIDPGIRMTGTDDHFQSRQSCASAGRNSSADCIHASGDGDF